MDNVKKHFEDEAKEFDEIILKLIPYYSEMVEALVSAIPFDKSRTIKVMDLGCGTGTVSKQIKLAFPKAIISCMDIAQNMIEMAKSKLAEYSDPHYMVEDFYHYQFTEEYDVIVSSLALHHLLTDNDKKAFYQKIYQGLAVNGVFYNADVILGSRDYLQELYMDKWREFMRRHVTEEEIKKKWIPTYYEEDRPAKLIEQIHWLEEIGFIDVDILWKYYNFAVYGGVRPAMPVGV
ncbi:MAG: methyltransferase domain-containing protein [Spirochaetota bacterium]|nr:methyltransferase domain-containing protein [Spirochaetota bacterium]